jgi:hypothetical protein
MLGAVGRSAVRNVPWRFPTLFVDFASRDPNYAPLLSHSPLLETRVCFRKE